MSSVSRFIRQVPLSTTYYNAGTVATSPATYAYEFVPTSANYVGNYPPGYMTTAATLTQAILNAANAASGASNLVLRDMGKTIYAANDSTATNFGYFRQVQLLRPNVVTSTQGVIGGTAGTTFGVLGAANVPDNNTDYLTFFIPVTVAGVTGLAAGATSAAYALAGGQM
jgi:hypothetical protein